MGGEDRLLEVGLGMGGRLRQYLRLVRPYGMLFLGLAPVFGAVANGEFNPVLLLLLFSIGMLYHVFTFVHNDIVDMAVDSRSSYVATRPLPAGAVPKAHAEEIAASAVVVMVALATCTWSIATIVLVLIAVCCAVTYNMLSKRLPFLECVLGLGVFSLALAGAMIATTTVSPLSWLVAVAFYLQWVFSVGVTANLKDVEEDAKSKVYTSPTVFGVTATNGKTTIPWLFRVYAAGISVAFLGVLGLPFLLGLVAGGIDGLPIPLVCYTIVSLLLLLTTVLLLRGPSPSRDTFLRITGVHEGFSLLLVPLVLSAMLLSAIGPGGLLLILGVIIVWPLSWFRLLYGKTLIPLE